MIYLVRGVVTSLLLIATVGLMYFSGLMNFSYGLEYGQTATSAFIYSWAFVCGDIVKAVLPLTIGYLFLEKHNLKALIGCLMFTVLVILSLLSSFGFSSTNREASTLTSQLIKKQGKALSKDLKTAEKKLEKFPPHRPVSTLLQILESKKQNRAWTSTSHCLEGEVTARKSRVFCREYSLLRSELATSREAQKIEANIVLLKSKISDNDTQSIKKTGDVQAKALASVLGWETGNVQIFMSFFISGVFELVSGFGLIMTFGLWETWGRWITKQDEAKKLEDHKTQQQKRRADRKASTNTKKQAAINKVSPISTSPVQAKKKPKNSKKIVAVNTNNPAHSPRFNEKTAEPKTHKSEHNSNLTFQDFTNEYLVTDYGQKVSTQALYDNYFLPWCKHNNVECFDYFDFIPAVKSTAQVQVDAGKFLNVRLVA